MVERLAAAMAGALLLPIVSDVAHGQANAGRVPKTVLDGVFTAAQAERGAAVYVAQCAACHDGADVDGPPLTGAPFLDRWREDTLDGLFEFIKTEMPQQRPVHCPTPRTWTSSPTCCTRTTFRPGRRSSRWISSTARSLVGPNGPQPLPSGALVRVVGCLTQNPSREWVITRADQPARARVGNEITAAEAAAAAGAALGHADVHAAECRRRRHRVARRRPKGSRQGCVGSARHGQPDSRHGREESRRDLRLISVRRPGVGSRSP